MIEDDNIFVHLSPVWRDKADFVIQGIVEDDSPSEEREQLWARQVSEDRFEICCIPFFAYDLALGDIVETGLEGDVRYVVQRVVQPSGHYTFRVYFKDRSRPTLRGEVLDEMERLGCLVEWSSEDMLAIDAPPDIAQTVADFLYERHLLGYLEYETGRTK